MVAFGVVTCFALACLVAASGATASSADYEELKYSVIRISAVSSIYQFLTPFAPSQEGTGLGSGFLVDPNTATPHGYQVEKADRLMFVTNAHVISNAQQVTVQIPAYGHRSWDAVVLDVSHRFDLALLALSDEPTFRDYVKAEKLSPMLPLRLDFAPAPMGQEVLALGFPLGQDMLKISRGIVAGFESVNNLMALQSTAPISPGNSGGPLLAHTSGSEPNKSASDLRVVGVNFAKSALEHAQNVNFVIPAWRVGQMLAVHTLGRDVKTVLSQRPLGAQDKGAAAAARTASFVQVTGDGGDEGDAEYDQGAITGGEDEEPAHKQHVRKLRAHARDQSPTDDDPQERRARERADQAAKNKQDTVDAEEDARDDILLEQGARDDAAETQAVVHAAEKQYAEEQAADEAKKAAAEAAEAALQDDSDDDDDSGDGDDSTTTTKSSSPDAAKESTDEEADEDDTDGDSVKVVKHTARSAQQAAISAHTSASATVAALSANARVQRKVQPLFLNAVEPSRALYALAPHCQEGIFIGELWPRSLLTRADPPILPGSFLVRVNGAKLDAFGMGKLPAYINERVFVEDLFLMTPGLFDDVEFETCHERTQGKDESAPHVRKHRVSKQYDDVAFGQGLVHLDEPEWQVPAGERFELFAGVCVAPLSLNLVDELNASGYTNAKGYAEAPHIAEPRLAVTFVDPGSYAARADVIRPGDMVDSVNGRSVRTLREYREAFSAVGDAAREAVASSPAPSPLLSSVRPEATTKTPEFAEEPVWTMTTDRGRLLAVPFKSSVRQQLLGAPWMRTPALSSAAGAASPNGQATSLGTQTVPVKPKPVRLLHKGVAAKTAGRDLTLTARKVGGMWVTKLK